MEFAMAKKKQVKPEMQVSPAKGVPRNIALCWDERRKALLACFASDWRVAMGRRFIIVYPLGTVGSLEEACAVIAEALPAQGMPSKDELERVRGEYSDVPFPVRLLWTIR
jgi:hypothetical protein